MSWSIGFDRHWNRDIGYGVPATCDHPGCGKEIDRGLAHVCANQEIKGGDGCGLYFCSAHLTWTEALGACCARCAEGEPPYEATPDVPEWLAHKLTDASWAEWRAENPADVAAISARLTPRNSTPNAISSPSGDPDLAHTENRHS